MKHLTNYGQTPNYDYELIGDNIDDVLDAVNTLKFHRQYSVGPYILDFFCPQVRLAIELDGEQHKDAIVYDKERESFLKNSDIKTIRFWNSEVLEDIGKVLNIIKENAKF